MAVYKDKKTGKWTCFVRYIDWQGYKKAKKKEGFLTRREALEYEREFMLLKTKDVNMGFSNFVSTYLEDIKVRIKPTTYSIKEGIISVHILPYFGQRVLSEITSNDILKWQNELLAKRDANGKGYSQTYLRTVQNQLNAIFNHACRFYGLHPNPCRKLIKMGKANGEEMLFWTLEEYKTFSEVMKKKPVSYYAFEILYWTGIRCGELLALTKSDFDLENQTVRINKNYQVVNGKELMLSPKSEKSNRIIDIPRFLCEEMDDYIQSLYGIDDDDRLFQVTKSYLHHELDRGAKESGVKRIRLHDIRHSNVALCIAMGYTPIQIGARLGHESVTITERYSHLYPSEQKKIANQMDIVNADGLEMVTDNG